MKNFKVGDIHAVDIRRSAEISADEVDPLKGERLRGHHIGWITTRRENAILVDYPGNSRGPLEARSVVPIPAWDGTGEERVPTLLVFEDECPGRPIVVGLLQPTPVVKAAPAALSGSNVQLEGRDQIELRCGKASLTLRRNGRVVIRGVHVETEAYGVNRIKGGAVKIN